MTSDLNTVRELYHQSVREFITGDPTAQKRLWSRQDDVTLANPLGPPVREPERLFEALDSAAAQISEGEGYTFETITWVETAEFAYEVGLEHARAKLGASSDQVPISLRVTTIFRREDGGWKVVLRHANTIADVRPIQSLAP